MFERVISFWFLFQLVIFTEALNRILNIYSFEPCGPFRNISSHIQTSQIICSVHFGTVLLTQSWSQWRQIKFSNAKLWQYLHLTVEDRYFTLLEIHKRQYLGFGEMRSSALLLKFRSMLCSRKNMKWKLANGELSFKTWGWLCPSKLLNNSNKCQNVLFFFFLNGKLSGN